MVDSVSLIITTYNWKEALDRVLLSVANQTVLPSEVVIADDGSRDDTRLMIQEKMSDFPCSLIHCWQEDKGFRAAAIRNKAIAQSKSDYVVMIDGDMILHQNFIRDHAAIARKGVMVQGGRVITSAETAQSILADDASIGFFTLGIGNRFNVLNSSLLSSVFSRTIHGLVGARTCNFAVWRDDLLRVNGFNEDFFGWGREDSELTARLLHIGKERLKLKFMATAYHLYHVENSRQCLAENDMLLEQCLREKWVWCDNGINKYLPM